MLSKKMPPPGSTKEPPLSVSSTTSDSTKPKVETLIAFANVRVEAAANPDCSERDRDANIKLARIDYEKALKREPKNLDALLGMAHTCRIMRERDPCADWYRRALKASPDNAAAIWGEMGQSLDGLQARETAINCYQEAIKLDPNNKPYRKALGLALAHSGRYDDGYSWLSQCMQPADAHVCIGRMMDHHGQRAPAEAQYTEALRIDPNHEVARLALSNSPEVADGIPEVNPIQPVNYEQYTPAPRNRSQPTENFTTAPNPVSVFTDRTNLSQPPASAPMQPR